MKKGTIAVLLCLFSALSAKAQTNYGRIRSDQIAKQSITIKGAQLTVSNGKLFLTNNLSPTAAPTPQVRSQTGTQEASGNAAKLSNTTLSFSATPVFDVRQNRSYTMNLTGKSSTTSGTPVSGILLPLALVQDVTGGRTFSFPDRFIFPAGYTFDTAAFHRKVLTSKFDRTNRNVVSIGGRSTDCTPGGSTHTLDKSNSGPCAGSTIVDDGTTAAIGSPVQKGKGPNPNIDVTFYGVRAVNPFSPPAATCTMTGGSAVATLNVASTFRNGDGVLCRGAGPTVTMSTPGAPTVVASNASWMLGTAQTVANSGGSSTDTYQIVAVDSKRGYTVASTARTITNGAVTKGASQVTISSWTRSASQVTVTTSSPHGLVTGAMVAITLADRTLLGNYQITVTGASTFTFSSQVDANNGGPTAGRGGTVTSYFGNHISWTPVTGAMQYIVYRTSSPAKVVCISWPDQVVGSSLAFDPLLDQCDDWGDTITAAPTLPGWAPSSPPAVAKNDDLITTIVSGAGTTTVTLGNTATNSVTAQPFIFDNGPTIASALFAAQNFGTAYFPAPTTSGNVYPVSSVTQVGGNLSVMQTGTIQANDTISFGGGFTRWQGSPAFPGTGGGSFSWNHLPTITGNAYPILWAKTGSSTLDLSFVTVVHTGANQGMGLLIDEPGIPATQLDHVQFGLSGTDFYGEGLTIRNNIAGGANFNFRFLQFSTGPLITDLTQAPVFQATQGFAPFTMENIFFNRRGMYIGMATTGTLGQIKNIYIQGGIMPTIALGNSIGGFPGATLLVNGAIQDTTAQSVVNYPNNITGTISILGVVTNTPTVSGTGNITIKGDSGDTGTTGSEGTAIQIGSVDNGATTLHPVKDMNAHTVIGPAYKETVTALTQVAPTCAVSAGGTVRINSYTFKVAPVFSDGGEGNVSPPSPSCATSGGNRTVTITWTAVPGAIGYDLYQNNFSFQCTPPWVSGGNTTSYVWTGTATCGSSIPGTALGGPTYMKRTQMGAPLLVMTSTDNGGRANLSMPVGTAARTQNFPDASGTVLLDSQMNGAVSPVAEWFDHFGAGLGSNYTNLQNSIVVSSSQFTGGLGGAWNAAKLSAANLNFNADQYAAFTLGTIGAGNAQVMACVRLQAATFSGYCGGVNTNGKIMFMQKFTAGASATMASVDITSAVGDYFVISAVGTNVTLKRYVNGALANTLGPNVDATYTTGVPGPAVFNTTSRGDNFEAGNGAPLARTTTEQDWNVPQHFVSGITLGNTLGTPLVTISGNSGRVGQTSGTLTQQKLATFDANGNVIAESGSGTLGVTLPAKLFIRFAECNNGEARLAVDTLAASTVGCFGTNSKIGVWQAADNDVVTFSVPLATDFVGTIDGRLFFNSPDTSGTVKFTIALACVDGSGATADDPAFNASSAFGTVTLAAPANAAWATSVSNITLSGTTTCAAGNWLNGKVVRATDSATSRVNAKGVELTVRRAF